MPHRPRARERAALLVAVIGALATIATSAPYETYELAESSETVLDPSAPTHVVVRIPRATIASGVTLLAQVSATGTEPVDEVTIVPDDGSTAPVTGSVHGTSASISLGDVFSLCPGEADCDIGFDVALESIAPRDGTVRAVLQRHDQPFPADTAIEVLFE